MEQVQPESPTRYMLPDQSSEGISTKKRKSLVKKEKAEKKPKTKKIKQEPEGKTFHEVPPIVENGGIVEVQVLEEGEIFNPDAFLDELAQQWHPLPPSAPQTSTAPFRNPSPPPQGSTEILYSCPVHLNDTLQKKETNTQYGHWEYYKCPVRNCYVSCGVDNVEYYLDSAKRQLHNFFLSKPVHVMECYCKRPLVMSLSQSEKNPGRLFLKCLSVGAVSFSGWTKNPEAKPKLGWKGVEFMKGIHYPKSCSHLSKETSGGTISMERNATLEERGHMLSLLTVN